MLFVRDLPTATTALASGEISYPHDGCEGTLGPWGWARERSVRRRGGSHERHRPRRGRCRDCRRTQVLAEPLALPRHADAIETVGAALLAAVEGAGYRPIAAELGLAATTVRGWLQRARSNSEPVRQQATGWLLALDPNADPPAPTGTVLGDMVNAVGQAVVAWVRRFGPVHSPWRTAVLLGAAPLLSPPGRRGTRFAPDR